MFLIYFLNKQSIDQQMVQRFLSGKIYVKKIILYIFSIYKFIYKANIIDSKINNNELI